ncbi:hypothetical protein CY34DRAFT_145591 [Suillus luteus UH-Slu-Lm8-n1]|uniref:Uncharacterized protein n=1 Tax=Suillus luteus UH-Slu-Lm8-n1 TaxID=930992 RepID=A0A0D0BGP8_9AGAM|nr:hypothetical protein CY34DRAFT_145591 [Suillus luteus UH-Slu-Lm8-n1]
MSEGPEDLFRCVLQGDRIEGICDRVDRIFEVSCAGTSFRRACACTGPCDVQNMDDHQLTSTPIGSTLGPPCTTRGMSYYITISTTHTMIQLL